MPQLLSRRDDTGWLTPSMADILAQRTAPLPPEENLRNQMSQIQQQLNDLDTPIRMTDIRPLPSHTLFIARPENRRNRQPATSADIRRGLGKVAEGNPEWTLGFMPQMPDDQDNVGILLRTSEHQPIKLRQVLLSNTYQHDDSTLAMALGITLEQQVIVQNLDDLGHLLIIGPYNSRRHVLREALLTLVMLNTPAELRIALLGASSQNYAEFGHTPHMLGRVLDTPENGQRLLEGMTKEIQRRRQWLHESQTDTLTDYNAHLQNQGEAPLPRIVILLSSLSDLQWQETSETWIPAVYDLIVNGATVGIHLFLTAEDPSDIPDLLDEVLETRMIMRSVRPDLADDLPYLHSTALRFIDAFVVSKQLSADLLPIELCTVSDQDIQNLVSYWRQLAVKRSQDSTSRERTGLTDLLPELEGSGLGTSDQARRGTAQLPTRTRAGTLARATQLLTGESDEKLVAQSMILAAYLGWLGVGPIRDIFGVSSQEALAVIGVLQSLGVIEESDGPIYRFLRLAENPLDEIED